MKGTSKDSVVERPGHRALKDGGAPKGGSVLRKSGDMSRGDALSKGPKGPGKEVDEVVRQRGRNGPATTG